MSCSILNKYNPAENADNFNELYNLQDLLFVLERLGRNIALVNTGVNTQFVTFSNTTLFRVACDYYDDATLWTYLADVNNLIDPEITSSITLSIPPKPPATVSFGT